MGTYATASYGKTSGLSFVDARILFKSIITRNGVHLYLAMRCEYHASAGIRLRQMICQTHKRQFEHMIHVERNRPDTVETHKSLISCQKT